MDRDHGADDPDGESVEGANSQSVWGALVDEITGTFGRVSDDIAAGNDDMERAQIAQAAAQRAMTMRLFNLRGATNISSAVSLSDDSTVERTEEDSQGGDMNQGYGGIATRNSLAHYFEDHSSDQFDEDTQVDEDYVPEEQDDLDDFLDSQHGYNFEPANTYDFFMGLESAMHTDSFTFDPSPDGEEDVEDEDYDDVQPINAENSSESEHDDEVSDEEDDYSAMVQSPPRSTTHQPLRPVTAHDLYRGTYSSRSLFFKRVYATLAGERILRPPCNPDSVFRQLLLHVTSSRESSNLAKIVNAIPVEELVVKSTWGQQCDIMLYRILLLAHEQFVKGSESPLFSTLRKTILPLQKDFYSSLSARAVKELSDDLRRLLDGIQKEDGMVQRDCVVFFETKAEYEADLARRIRDLSMLTGGLSMEQMLC